MDNDPGTPEKVVVVAVVNHISWATARAGPSKCVGGLMGAVDVVVAVAVICHISWAAPFFFACGETGRFVFRLNPAHVCSPPAKTRKRCEAKKRNCAASRTYYSSLRRKVRGARFLPTSDVPCASSATIHHLYKYHTWHLLRSTRYLLSPTARMCRINIIHTWTYINTRYAYSMCCVRNIKACEGRWGVIF